MTQLEERLINDTLEAARNLERNQVFIGDPIRIKLYWTIIETCLDREDRDEIVGLMIKDREIKNAKTT